MGQRPLISVVVPTYNRAKTLFRALSSILNQSFPDLEVIVVDDGSRDETASLVSSIQDSRLRYFYQANRGVSVARNRGIAESRGLWIAFLDSDDEWFSQKLETQLAQLEKDRLLWNHSEEIWIRHGRRVNPRNKHRKPSGRIYLDCLALCAVSPSTVLIHRKLLEETGGFDPLLPVAEDYDLWLRIASRYSISFCEDPLIRKYGGHPDQLSRTFLGLDRFRVRSLRKQLNSLWLSEEEKEATRQVFSEKCRILAQGYEKHQKPVIAEYYRQLLQSKF